MAGLQKVAQRINKIIFFGDTASRDFYQKHGVAVVVAEEKAQPKSKRKNRPLPPRNQSLIVIRSINASTDFKPVRA